MRCTVLLVRDTTAMAIEREGPTCTVTHDDFVRAIAASKRAKQDVGTPQL
ncbi:MAG: hypothetical protein GYB66_01445 [Chloroflexi bacterium]|nr:hypothetical protein [Chloroflexota bacterium]